MDVIPQQPGQPIPAAPAPAPQPVQPVQPVQPGAPAYAQPVAAPAPAPQQFQMQPAAPAQPGVDPQAAAVMSNMFSGITAAKASMSSNYFKAGHYLFRVNAVKVGVSRKQESFVAVEVTTIHIFDNDDGRGHRVGEEATHMLMQKFDQFLPNMKAFIAAACSMEANDITEQNALSVCGPEQPLAGTVVECQNRITMTQKNNQFTRVNYVRQVLAAELLQLLPVEVQTEYFPDGALQNLAAHQAQYQQ